MNPEIQKVIQKLGDLQLLDRDLVSAEIKMVENPKKVEEIKEKIQKQREWIDAEKERLKNLEHDQHAKENDLKYREDKTKRIEARIRTVRSGKEYQALLRETALAKKENSELEEEIIRAMEEIEQVRAQVAAEEEALKNGEQQSRGEIDKLLGELEGLEGIITNLSTRRGEITKELGREVLQRYQRIRDRVSWNVVTEVKAGICQGCHVNVPPQLFNQVLRCEEIYQCPNCHRILYSDGGKQHEQTAGEN